MIFDRWDSAFESFKTITDNPRFGLQARQMIELMPILRAHPDFAEIHGWASHAVLHMMLPKKNSTHLKVWAESEDAFLVYIESAEGRIDPITVSKAELVSTLAEYLKRLY